MVAGEGFFGCDVSGLIALFYMFLHVSDGDRTGVRTSTKAIRIRESLAVADLPALTAGVVAGIDRVGSQHHFRYFVSPHRTYYSHDVPDSLSIFLPDLCRLLSFSLRRFPGR